MNTSSERQRIKLLEFDETQQAAVAAALMAVADQTTSTSTVKPKNEPLRSGDVIDLLTDSDEDELNSSDCEILGYLSQDIDEQPITHISQIKPFEVKTEVKAELAVETSDAYLPLGNDGNFAIVHNNVNSSAGQLLNDCNQAAHHSETATSDTQGSSTLHSGVSLDDFVKHVEQTASHMLNGFILESDRVLNEQSTAPEQIVEHRNSFPSGDVSLDDFIQQTPTESNNNNNVQETMPYDYFFDHIPFVENKKSLEMSSNGVIITSIQTIASSSTEAAAANDTDTASEASSGELYAPECDNDDDDASNSNYNYPAIVYEDGAENNDIIIELDDSDSNEADDADANANNNDDYEVEQKLVSLIESDSEDNAATTTTTGTEGLQQQRENNINMLISYICPECNVPCGNNKKWKAHIDSEHDFLSLEKMNLQTIIDKEGELCYQCKQCYHKFNFKVTFAVLFKHRITHATYSDYHKCRLCEMRFHTRASTIAHLRRAHHKICQSYVRNSSLSLWQHVKYHCPICNLVLKQRSNWQKHLEVKHDFTTKLEDKVRTFSDSIVECCECDKRFRKQRAFEHALLHEEYKSYHCKICKDFEAYSFAVCIMHIRIQHYQGGKNYLNCRYCEGKFERNKEYKDHLKKKHYAQRQKFKCPVCKKTFASAAVLLWHMNISNHHKLK